MTPLLTIPQEMFFVVLTALFLAAVVCDLRHSQFFRSWRNMPSPWKALSKGMKRFFLILTASLAWTQNKINMSRATPEGDSRPGAALHSMVDGRACSQPGEEAGIPYALRTGDPPYASNAVLTASQFESGFACVAVTAIQPSALAAPSNAVAFTEWPYAVARRAALLPPGLLPGGFTFGGRPVTDLYMAASGMLSFDSPKSSPFPATDGIPDGSAQNYMAVLQTPSDIVPPGGVFWYAPGADSSLFTWKDVFLGQDTNCLATVQAELFADGGFTFRYSLPSAAESYAAVTNPVLIGAQNNSGGETVLFTNSLAAVHPSLLPAFELRWKSLAGLDPDAPDYDSDELSDADELFIHHTDPRNPDTDGDGLLDGEEVLRYGTDPLKPDTFGDGTNDFWRVFAPSSLTDSPWMDGGEGLSLLTLETRLEGAAGGLAALRIGDVIVPVLPGTARVCRVAFPCNAAVPFALVFAPGSEAASASVTALDSEGPVVFGDPGDVFTLPFAPGAGGLQMTAAPPAPPRNNTGILCGVKYGFNPSHLCPHTGRDSLKISPMGGYPKNSGITGIGFVTAAGALTNELRVTEGQAEALAQAQGKTSPGPHTVNYPAVVGVLAVSGRKILKPTATNSVPVHHCVFTSGGGEDPPPEGACPCCTNQVCPCRCPSPGVCECAACRDPYAVNAPTNSAGQPLATQNRPRRLLLTGGAPDTVSAGPQSADGSSANGRCAYCQCRQFTPPPGDLPARAWRVTGGLAVSPPSLATNGVFTVADVFTWKAGPVYSRGRYTVAGLSAAFPHAVPDAAPRLQLGHTNALLVTTQIPADNAGTVRFSGYAPGAAVSVSNRVTGQYDPLQPSYAAAAWRDSYLSPSQTAELRCVAAAAGQHGFTVTYELADASPPSVSRTLAFEAIRIQSEPVTSVTDADGHVYNPSGMPAGADGRFKVAVAEGAVPGADITWTVKEGAGRVSFVDDDGTGPDIAIHAAAAGDFTLEADVKGLVLTPPHVRPYFVGEVLQPKTVPVAVWVARHTDGRTPADPSRIAGMIADANKILWQAAITLAWNGTISYTNRDDWYALELPPGNVVTNGSTVWQLMNCTNDTGGVELYFVNDMIQYGGGHDTRGMNVRGLGSVLSRQATGHTLAHEIMHECGLADIYNNDGGLSVSGAIGPGRLSSADWGGGYYPPGLRQADFNSGRLLMYGIGEPATSVAINIPRSDVYGVGFGAPAQTNLVLGPVSVGRDSMEAGEPVH